MLLAKLSRKRYTDCVLVRVDDGIGMAVAQDGRIMDDTEKLELGHTVAVRDGLACACGRRGCLEAYASLRGMAGRAGVGTDALFADSERYASVWNDAADHLVQALYNMCVLFRPQRLILTGRAFEMPTFAARVQSFLCFDGVEVRADHTLSAAFGAAAESMKSAIKDFEI
jgi:predicted NBD/HSP70 family sugar kinase